MLLPAFLHGQFREVKPRCQKLVTQLRRGARWSELTGELIDTRDVPGLLVMHGPSPNLGHEPHFHCFAPMQAVDSAIPHRLGEEYSTIILHESLKTAWGVLGLISDGGKVFIWRAAAEERRLFLDAVLRYWDELDSEGARYTFGQNLGQSLWSLPTTIKYCLGMAGISEEQRRGPLPPGGLRELLQDIPDAPRLQ